MSLWHNSNSSSPLYPYANQSGSIPTTCAAETYTDTRRFHAGHVITAGCKAGR